MKFTDPFFTDPFFGQPRRMRRVMISFSYERLLPGQQATMQKLDDNRVRPDRLIAKFFADWPVFVRYQKKVGGSKNRGKRASWKYHADVLRHGKGTWRPSASLDDIRIDRQSQMSAPGYGVPLDIFSEHAPDMGLNLDQGAHIQLQVTNREEYRDITSVRIVILAIAPDDSP